MRILVVEDEQRMAALLQQGLVEEGYQVCVASDGRTGVALAQTNSFDAIILDVTLPLVDGLTVARTLRKASNQTPILILTARDRACDVIEGLNVGADDYVTKPFSFEVLLARVRAVTRRGPIPQPVSLELADLCLNTATRRVTRQGRLINLTPREHSLLELLMRNAGRPVTRETILESVWGFDTEVGENTLEAFVRLLRNKIDLSFEVKLIQTIRGIGYCMRVPDA